jgi:ubiquinone/menaquinone biosynthesis C-methylase UbiE
MERAEFDKFAEEYKSLHSNNIASSGESPEYFAEYKMKDLQRIVEAVPTVPVNGFFLDFGAGVGASVPFFRKHLPSAHLTCVDVSKNSLEIAASSFGNTAEYVTFDGTCLPFADNSFDAAYACCVFHHISPEMHIHHLQELRRVLKINGVMVIYEHNPFNPLTVRAVNTCPFDENAILIKAAAMKARLELAGFGSAEISYRVFFPRFLSSIRWMEDWLKWLPVGAQYYVRASKADQRW